jgi:hypothetical protein
LLGTFNTAIDSWSFGNASNTATGWAAYPAAPYNPSVLYLSGTGGSFSYSTITAPVKSVNLHPGSSGQYAVAKWIAPASGIYDISGSFRGNDTGHTTTDVHVLVNGTSLFDGAISSYAQLTPFSLSGISLVSGGTVSFAVGYGSNLTYFNDSTGLAAQIAAVPEPETWAMMLAGLSLLGWMSRRRREPGNPAAA